MSSSDRSDQTIVKTKLAVPQLGATFLSRVRLLDQLAQATSHAVTLICAPAGYGKTSLLVEWARGVTAAADQAVARVCWLSLDAGDNDPYGFLSYLMASIRLAEPRLDGTPRGVLSTFPQPPLQVAMGMLINDLLALDSDFVLALDDYQLISNPAIHAGMTYFIEHLPSNVHVVIAARSDPPIPLARLRALNQLLEIRAKDLEFTLAETAELLNRRMGLGISAEDLSRLLERTEGWIAGLQMATLAIRNQPDSSSFVRDFSGSNRYILDYLVEEVLNSQPEDIRNFLLKTSVINNLSGPLCDAVRGMAAASVSGSSQAILEQLDNANMFLVPLDAERTWYRYHHLFADLLQTRLRKEFPEEVAELHTRAAKWFEQQQRTPEAIDHFLAARAYDAASRLIDTQVEQLVGRNDMYRLLGWIRELPAEVSVRHPWCNIAQAWMALFRDNVAKIEPFVQAAEENISADDPPDLRNTWRGHIACLRGFRADAQGDTSGTIEMAKLGLQAIRPTDTANRNFARYMLGRAYFLSGDLARAEETLKENLRESIETESTNIIAPTLACLGRVYRAAGRLREGMRVLQEGWTQVENWDPLRVSAAGAGLGGQAYIQFEWNDLAAAERTARRSLELCERWLHPTSICNSYCMLVRVHVGQGQMAAAAEALRCAEESVRGHKPFAEAASDLNAVRIRYWLAAGEVSEAARWAAELKGRPAFHSGIFIPTELDQITLARVALADERLEDALRELEQLEVSAESGQRYGNLIEILVLQSLALQGRGDMVRAQASLEKSLKLGEAEGYTRIYMEEGKPIQRLLERTVRSSFAAHKSYAEKLLAAMGEARIARTAKAQDGLIEPLTPRELDVLRLLTGGFSNRQISETLVLSEGTIKFHVHNVLEKLGVHTRAEAIARATKDKLP